MNMRLFWYYVRIPSALQLPSPPCQAERFSSAFLSEDRRFVCGSGDGFVAFSPFFAQKPSLYVISSSIVDLDPHQEFLLVTSGALRCCLS